MDSDTEQRMRRTRRNMWLIALIPLALLLVAFTFGLDSLKGPAAVAFVLYLLLAGPIYQAIWSRRKLDELGK
jgi:hypothetical protein